MAIAERVTAFFRERLNLRPFGNPSSDPFKLLGRQPRCARRHPVPQHELPQTTALVV